MVAGLKKIGIWLKKWSFLILIVLTGAGYLTMADSWEVYAAPLRQAKAVWNAYAVPGQKGEADGADPAMAPDGRDDPQEGALGKGSPADEPADGTVNGVSAGDLGGAQNAAGTEAGGGQEPVTYRTPEEVVYHSVEDDYFRDAVFIGDSRTVGLYEYGGLQDISTFYASTGLTVYKLFDARIVEVEGQKQKETVEWALSQRSFSRIYLMIGINEMGTGTVDSFLEAYGQAVEHLRELQPDAIIYLQGIMKVTTERSSQGDYITNEGIEERNEGIAALADNVNVYYLDVNPLICDDTGGMEASYTFDGVHLKAQYVSLWKDYLKSHAADKLMLD